MKKAVIGILVIIALSLLGTVNVNAGQQKMGSFYIGPFVLNQANWTNQMDRQLLRGIENVPDGASLEIYGHTDNSGPMDFNEGLADERAGLAAQKIAALRPDITISAVTGKVFQAGSNDIDYRMARIDIYVSNGWFVSNKELAEQFKIGLANINEEQVRQRQSIKELETLSRKTNQEVKDIKRELKTVSGNYQPSEFSDILSMLNVCIALAILALVMFSYFMIRRYQNKTTTEIVKTIKSSVVEARRVEAECENEIYIVRAERRSDGFWYSPFKLSNGNEIYRAEWVDIKKSIKGSIKDQNQNFQKQKEAMIAEGAIKVKDIK